MKSWNVFHNQYLNFKTCQSVFSCILNNWSTISAEYWEHKILRIFYHRQYKPNIWDTILVQLLPCRRIVLEMSRVFFIFLFLSLSTLVSSQFSRHSFPRGYRNGRAWGTGPQRTAKSFNQRKGEYNVYWFIANNYVLPARQFEEKMSACSSCSPNQLQGAVCGTDGKTYNSECKLKQAGCSNVRRQGNYNGERQTYIWNSYLLQVAVSSPPCWR